MVVVVMTVGGGAPEGGKSADKAFEEVGSLENPREGSSSASGEPELGGNGLALWVHELGKVEPESVGEPVRSLVAMHKAKRARD
ncbi:unnamed protein product [Boreogadus saida]